MERQEAELRRASLQAHFLIGSGPPSVHAQDLGTLALVDAVFLKDMVI